MYFNRQLTINRCVPDKLSMYERMKKAFLTCYKILFSLIVLIAFILLISLVVYNLNFEDNEELYTSTVTPALRLKVQPAQCFSSNPTVIACKNFAEFEVDLLAHRINVRANKDFSNKLVLSNISFIDKRIDKSWLQVVKAPINVLELLSCSLAVIGPEAFTGAPFEHLENLLLYDTEINYLKRDSFLYTQLKVFRFINPPERKKLLGIDEQILESMVDTLVELSFINSLRLDESLRNLTASNREFWELQYLHLNNNELTTITSESFVKFPNLAYLNLSSNLITHIDNDAFLLNNLQELDISANLLTTLDKGVFDFMNNSKIYLHGNDWWCNCDMLWFKQFYYENRVTLFNNDVFLCNDRIPWDKVKFCGNDTTPLFGTTTDATSKQPINDDVKLNCGTSPPIEAHTSLHFSYKISFKNNTIEFLFYQIDNQATYIIQVNGNHNTNNLLWINANNRSDVGCLILSKTLQISLRYGQTYTFCLIQNGMDCVSPYDCTSILVPAEWSLQTWLENSKQPVVLGLFSSIILVTILISCLIMFYCIRQNPNLIKGNKRVIIVGNKTTDAIVLPKTYKCNNNVPPPPPPSIKSCNDGYLTPKTNYYESDEKDCNHCGYFYNGPALSTISEKSLECIYADVEYDENKVDCGGTMKIDKNPMRRRTLGRISLVHNENLYEPPPLPPNHPSENLYTPV